MGAKPCNAWLGKRAGRPWTYTPEHPNSSDASSGKFHKLKMTAKDSRLTAVTRDGYYGK
jgi:hypothetical protein